MFWIMVCKQVMYDLEEMFPKAAYLFALFLPLGDVMAGTWAAILDSEVVAVCQGCQNRKIEGIGSQRI